MTTPAAAILIVDDESQNRRLLAALLAPEGYVTRTAGGGQEALSAIAHDPPDLILLDVMMPGIDGRTVAAAVKADPATRHIPIIMVTAQSDRESRLAALDAGAEDFLTKPIDRAELWLRVRNLLRLKDLNDLLESHRATLEAEVRMRTADLRARTADLQLFRTAMDAAGDAIFLVDRTTMTFVEANATASKMLGYSRDELFALGPIDLLGMPRGELEVLFDAVIAGQRPAETTESIETISRKDSSTLLVEVHRHAQRSGSGWIIVGVLRDVTQREADRAASVSDRANLRATVDSLLDPHVLLSAVRDPAGQIVDFVYADANPAACVYNRLSYRGLIGARLLDLLPGNAGRETVESYRQVVDTGNPLVLDDTVYSQELPGGTARHYDTRAARAGDGLSLTWRDVTDRHAAKERREQFLSHVSHELRSPLAVVHQFTSLLSDCVGGPLTGDQEEFLAVVMRNVGQLKVMIDDLLEVSRSETGQLAVDCRPMALGELLTQATAGSAWAAKERDIAVCLELGDLPPVHADRERMYEVLTNLIDNALKFTPRGGRILVAATAHDGHVQVDVSDTGLGIAPHDIEHIFEEFFQADHDATASRNGLGLGLFICRDLIERQGGTIAAVSTVGCGTTVTFTVPIAPSQEAAHRSVAAQGHRTGQ